MADDWFKRDGDPLEPADLNRCYRELRRLRRTTAAPPLAIEGAEGGPSPPRISLHRRPRMFARLTSSYSGGYAWEEILVGPGRGLTVGLSGSPAGGSPSYERRTGDATLTADGAIYRFEQSPASGEWLFAHRSSGGPVVSVPGCTCARMPVSLAFTVTNSALTFGILQSATLAYGPTPSAFSRLSLGAYSYLSTTSYNDQSTGDQFWYYFACLGGYYIITRVYKTSIYGSPYRDTIRYKWLVGNTGNTCTPFALTNGQIYPGGNPLCVATIG